MAAFLIAFVVVVIAVDLLVRFVVDPFLDSSKKKNKASKVTAPKFDPAFRLATETMYDGGKERKEEESNSTIKK